MLQWEHSAILSTFIKLPFVIKIFVLSIFEWPLKTGFTVCVFMFSISPTALIIWGQDHSLKCHPPDWRNQGWNPRFIRAVVYLLHSGGKERSGSVGRVLDLGSKDREFEIHWSHCVVSLSKTLYPLLSMTGNCLTEKLLTGM